MGQTVVGQTVALQSTRHLYRRWASNQKLVLEDHYDDIKIKELDPGIYPNKCIGLGIIKTVHAIDRNRFIQSNSIADSAIDV